MGDVRLKISRVDGMVPAAAIVGCLFQAESSPIIVRHDDTPRVMSEQQQRSLETITMSRKAPR